MIYTDTNLLSLPMKRAYRRITEEELRNIVNECDCFADVCRYLNRSPVGGNITNISLLCRRWNIDTSHMLNKRPHNKGKPAKNKRHWHSLLAMGSGNTDRRIGGGRLRRALIEAGVEYKCNYCGLTEWRGKKILEVDHIDGQYWNNLKENLQFLCPNCHAAKDNCE